MGMSKVKSPLLDFKNIFILAFRTSPVHSPAESFLIT
ncbi:MAG: hypothetical protein JWQ14_2516 [Adhaeribacter sp.]|nr:hypothetical protein [Adhaeribacter sp.]